MPSVMVLVPLGHAEQHPHLGLHIGGEARVGHGVDLGGQDVAGAGDPDGGVKFLHLGAAAAQLGGDGLEVFWGWTFRIRTSPPVAAAATI